jgi:hypothetical protein
MPSLTQLSLYQGTLQTGALTRFGVEVASLAARDQAEEASELLARQLIAVDRDKVGLIAWLEDQAQHGTVIRHQLVDDFFLGSMPAHAVDAKTRIARDRLGKWTGYLIHFGLLRERRDALGSVLELSGRHLAAVSAQERQHPPLDLQRQALLESYAACATRLGSRLYIPVQMLRDEIGYRLRARGFLVTDFEIDGMLKNAVLLLEAHQVAFSPFSGPSRGGVSLPSMYAGFISIKPQTPKRVSSGQSDSTS